MNIINKSSSIMLFQLVFLIVLSFVIRVDNAVAVSVVSPGSTAVISIDPTLPKKGEPFTINVTGEWRDSCIPDQESLTYVLREYSETARPELVQMQISLRTSLVSGNLCPNAFNPTPYKLSVKIDKSVWDVIYTTVEIVEDSVSDRYVSLARFFDLVLGIHEIPPRLGSGYWLSEDTPSQGLLIEQQASTVVFYELQYNRVSGEPNWYYANGNFSGNRLVGVAYLVNWLAPVEGATFALKHNPDLNPSELPFYRLVQPEDRDLLFEESSAGINVRGYNRLSAFVGLHEADGELTPVFHDYKRWVFALDEPTLPVVVPNMIGPWVLHGFNGQSLEQTHQIQFDEWQKADSDLYRFTSNDDQWVLECHITLRGEGDCLLVSETFGLEFHYYLDKIPNDPTLVYFNGNYALAPLVSSTPDVPNQTGVLIRSGVTLPALGVQ